MQTRRKSWILAAVAVAAVAAAAVPLAPSLAGGAQAASHRGRPTILSRADIQTILDQAVATADAIPSPLRSLPAVQRMTKMHIALVGRDGKLLAVRSMPDAWVGSIDIAIAKARTAAFFSSDENALTSRIIGILSQAHNPDGSGGAGPLWGIGNSNQVGITGSHEYRNGLITFPGGVALYKNGRLAGGIGVSGDGVDQDEAVAFGGAAGFLPGSDVAQLGY